MAKDVQLSIKRVFSDRPYLGVMAAVLLTTLIYCLVIGLSVQPREVQVYTHYTAFGDAHFFKNHWQYLILFGVFGLIVTVAHLGIMVKLHNIEKREAGMVVGYMTIILLIIAGAYALSIIRLALR